MQDFMGQPIEIQLHTYEQRQVNAQTGEWIMPRSKWSVLITDAGTKPHTSEHDGGKRLFYLDSFALWQRWYQQDPTEGPKIECKLYAPEEPGKKHHYHHNVRFGSAIPRGSKLYEDVLQKLTLLANEILNDDERFESMRLEALDDIRQYDIRALEGRIENIERGCAQLPALREQLAEMRGQARLVTSSNESAG
jgi:hypothetical protein